MKIAAIIFPADEHITSTGHSRDQWANSAHPQQQPWEQQRVAVPHAITPQTGSSLSPGNIIYHCAGGGERRGAELAASFD